MSSPERERLEEIVASVEQRFSDAMTGSEWSHGDLIIVIRRASCHDVFKYLRTRGFDMLVDIAGVDMLEVPHEDRFQVVYNLYSITEDLRLRVKVNVPENDMNVPSVSDIWQSANWSEREAYDMFGFRFEGHPNLSRILCHNEFEGHALRKDYPIMKGQWATTSTDLMPDLERE